MSLFKSAIFSVVALFIVLMSACSDCCALPLGPIPTLMPIEEMKAHYSDLSVYAATERKSRKALDEIAFPHKKNKWLTKLFNPAYLTRTQINDLMIQLKPAANSSKQTEKELEYLINLQQSRTDEQVRIALNMHDIVYFPLPGLNDPDALFYEVKKVINKELSVNEYPKTQRLLHKLMKDMRIMEFEAKNHFLRARPRQLDRRLAPLKKMDSSSFASGHTLWAYIQAYTLAQLLPEKRAEFLQLAYDIGLSREILGVHYPSDEEAARKLAYQMLSVIWQKDEFKKDFYAAYQEWQ